MPIAASYSQMKPLAVCIALGITAASSALHAETGAVVQNGFIYRWQDDHGDVIQNGPLPDNRNITPQMHSAGDFPPIERKGSFRNDGLQGDLTDGGLKGDLTGGGLSGDSTQGGLKGDMQRPDSTDH